MIDDEMQFETVEPAYDHLSVLCKSVKDVMPLDTAVVTNC